MRISYFQQARRLKNNAHYLVYTAQEPLSENKTVNCDSNFYCYKQILRKQVIFYKVLSIIKH